MKKKILIVTCTIITISCTLCSCAQNDGEIGSLFGLWSLNDYYSEDVHLSGEQCYGNSIKFQSNVVQYVKNLPYHDSELYTGTWRVSSDSLFLSFPFEANIDEDQYDKVVFPIISSLGFKINTLSNSVLDISRTTSEGVELRYCFKKLN